MNNRQYRNERSNPPCGGHHREEPKESDNPALRQPLESVKLSETEHPGAALLFLNKYRVKSKNSGALDAKRELTKAACGINPTVYKTAYERWKNTPTSAAAMDIVLQTRGRLVVGLGNASPQETGIALHHTYGVPVIPGAAVKGLCSHYAHTVHRPDPRKPWPLHEALFGTTKTAGYVRFHDAWILPESHTGLLPDVMTPHHMVYNEGERIRETGHIAPPSDTDDPNPVAFLSVRGKFLFRLDVPDLPPTEARDLLDQAARLLREALEHWGIGGKTSSGYGRMIEDPEEKKQREEEQRKAAMSPVRQAMEEQGYDKPRSNFEAVVKEVWIPKLDPESSDAAPPDERLDIARLLKQWYLDNNLLTEQDFKKLKNNARGLVAKAIKRTLREAQTP